jgi:hypothetical protein
VRLVLRHAFPMLVRVQRPSGQYACLIIVETGDALSSRLADEVGAGGKGHEQYERFHCQRQKSLKRVGKMNIAKLPGLLKRLQY